MWVTIYLGRRVGKYQYLSTEDREKLLRDYRRAWDNYQQAVARARESYAKMVRLGLLPGESQQAASKEPPSDDDTKSRP